MPGTITLYNRQGTRLAKARYYYKCHMRSIVKAWGQLFGTKFKTYHYHISPDIDDRAEIKGLTIKQARRLRA